MATCQVLIKRALRLLGELNSGREPPANETADCLEALQDLYKHLVAIGTLGQLRSVVISADYTAGENERITVLSGTPVITLPTTINDATTGCGPYDYGFSDFDGNLRAPRDRAVVVEAGATPKTYVYDADLASWVQIDTLTLTGPAPFTQKLKTGMAALLATHIASEYRDAPVPTSVAIGAAQCMATLTSRADSARLVTQSESF